jgi:hypothetical protein
MTDLHNKAFIRDDALILHFDTAQTPFVARFDLDSLVQANFEVTNKDNSFYLTLRDFSGNQQNVAQFSAKADAHQALYAILQALLSHKREGDTSCSKKSPWCCILKWLIGILLFVGILYVGFIWLMASSVSKPVAARHPMAAVHPAAPEGEPTDLSTILPPQQ